MPKLQIQTLAPETAEQAAEIMTEAWQNRMSVNIRGGGTKQQLGNVGATPHLTLSTLKMNKLIAYEPSDLTVSVQAGMRWVKLREILAAGGQRLALDPPELPDATVAGVIASNVSGPKRLLYGTARDLVIGCQFVLADGTIGRSGGKVVKNVTGYDLHKLLIGSLGTLALLTELNFKVMPLPETTAWLIAGFEQANVALETARKLARSNLNPVALEVVNRAALGDTLDGLPDANYLLIAGAEGVEVAVTRQLEEMEKICQEQNAVKIGAVKSRPVADYLWKLLRDLPANKKFNLRLRLGSLLTGLPANWQLAEKLAADLEIEATLQARAGTGLVYLNTNLPAEKAGEALAAINRVRGVVERQGGSLVVELAPGPFRERLDVWGKAAGNNSQSAMVVVKKQLDERGLLNPGKFVGGI